MSIETGAELTAAETIRSGFRHSPELAVGLRLTTVYALIASVGQVVVPIAVQQTLDRAVDAPHPMVFAGVASVICLAALLLTSYANYLMTARLYVASERGLATLRTKAFRHVHDLPLLTQNTERRGALVSRVTSDVDQISQFMQYGGLMIIIAGGQLVVASVLMAIYSWPLALLVWVVFTPLAYALRFFQRWLSRAYGVVRERVLDSETPALSACELVHRGRERHGLAGRLCPNAVLADGTRLDDAGHLGFTLLTTAALPDPEHSSLTGRGVRVVVVDPGSPLASWLSSGRAGAALVRPDFTVLEAGDLAVVCAALPTVAAPRAVERRAS